MMEKIKPEVPAKPKIDSVKLLRNRFESSPEISVISKERNNLPILQLFFNDNNTIDVSVYCENKKTIINECQVIYPNEKIVYEGSNFQFISGLCDFFNLKVNVNISDTIMQWSDLKCNNLSNNIPEDLNKTKLINNEKNSDDDYGDTVLIENFTDEQKISSKQSKVKPHNNFNTEEINETSDAHGDVNFLKSNIKHMNSTRDMNKNENNDLTVPQLPSRNPPKKQKKSDSKHKIKIAQVSEDTKVIKSKSNDNATFEEEDDEYGNPEEVDNCSRDHGTWTQNKDLVKNKNLTDKSTPKLIEKKEAIKDKNQPKVKKNFLGFLKKSPKDSSKDVVQDGDDEDGSDTYGDVDNEECSTSNNRSHRNPSASNRGSDDRIINNSHSSDKLSVEEDENENSDTYGDVDDADFQSKSSAGSNSLTADKDSMSLSASKISKRIAASHDDSKKFNPKSEKKRLGIFVLPRDSNKDVVQTDDADEDGSDTYGDVDNVEENFSNNGSSTCQQQKRKTEKKTNFPARSSDSEHHKNVSLEEEEEGSDTYGDVEDPYKSKSDCKTSTVHKDSIRKDDVAEKSTSSLPRRNEGPSKEDKKSNTKKKKKILGFFSRASKDSNKEVVQTDDAAEDGSDTYGDVEIMEENVSNNGSDTCQQQKKKTKLPPIPRLVEDRKMSKCQPNEEISKKFDEDEGGSDTYGDIDGDGVDSNSENDAKTSSADKDVKRSKKEDSTTLTKKSIAPVFQRNAKDSSSKPQNVDDEDEDGSDTYGDVDNLEENKCSYQSESSSSWKSSVDVKQQADVAHEDATKSKATTKKQSKGFLGLLKSKQAEPSKVKQTTDSNSSLESTSKRNVGGGGSAAKEDASGCNQEEELATKRPKRSEDEGAKENLKKVTETSQEQVKLGKGVGKKAKKMRMPNANEKKAFAWTGDEANLGTLVASHEYKPSAQSTDRLHLSPGDELEIWREDEEGLLLARKLKDGSWGFVDDCFLEGDKGFLTKNIYG